MRRSETSYATKRPERRPLKIFALDPMLSRMSTPSIELDIRNEPLRPGPTGDRVAVVDFNTEHGCYYPPVNLDDPAVLMQGGLDPSESDPRFHQQMVYAVAMRTIENFDRALGRQLQFRRRGKRLLRLFPHAFYGANAFYSSRANAVFFGYFTASETDFGSAMPGQTVFTCLSHDIITHELTHAIVDRLRPLFMEASNVDVLAFHEGFSDIVALFQHFTFTDLLRAEIQRTSTTLRADGAFAGLAQEFGEATGLGRALRSAVGRPEMRLTAELVEPHERGAVLVAAIFDGFSAVYHRRIRDLLRIATGGSGRLPEGDLHPDLVGRIANEASRTAQAVLSMCMRAFDYLPPVDITFGDFLRAMVTADYELSPDDETGLRALMIDAFRARSIFPRGVTSLAEESLIWDSNPGLLRLPVENDATFWRYLTSSLTRFGLQNRSRVTSVDADIDENGSEVSSEAAEFEEPAASVTGGLAVSLKAWADRNRPALSLDLDLPISVRGFHSVFRVAPTGQLLVELVAQFVQSEPESEHDLGGIPFRGGTTVVASFDGTVRYVIAKPLPSALLDDKSKRMATQRREETHLYLQRLDSLDAAMAYRGVTHDRLKRRSNLAYLHSL